MHTIYTKKLVFMRVAVVLQGRLFSHPNVRGWLPRVKVMLIETHDLTLNLAGCSAAVREAASQDFIFVGHLNEYEYFINRNLENQLRTKSN